MANTSNYTEENIKSLDWREHIRLRPGMYIGKSGDGSSPDDGIYVLLKEIIDNCVDEFVMGEGKVIDIKIDEDIVSVRDYGRGIPIGKVVDVVSKMNTGGKYDTRAFKKAVGLNGVGTKAVNALSDYFKVESNRDGQTAFAEFNQGELKQELQPEQSSRRRGTKVTFVPDESIFKNFKFRSEYISRMLKNYVYLNPGLTIIFNNEKYYSENGLKDLLIERIKDNDIAYPIIHLIGEDIEVAIIGCYVNGPGESKVADIGLTGAANKSLLYVSGSPNKKLDNLDLVNQLENEEVKLILEQKSRIKMDIPKYFDNVVLAQYVVTGIPLKVYVNGEYLIITDMYEISDPLIGSGMDEDGNMNQFDYRETLGTLVQDYLGADNYAIDSTFFNHSTNESICENKINELVMTEFSVAENCFSNTLTNQNFKETFFKVVPNPFSKELRIVNDDYTSNINLELFDLNSKL